MSETDDPNAVLAFILDQTKREEKQATLEEFLFVGCVATILVAYLVACVYSFFHPVAVPLPDYEAFYSAYNISNVTVEIMNPVSNSQITPQGVKFEWKIANFPVEALYQYGAEVFQYRVSINDDEITSEIGFLALDEGRNGPTDNALNHTVQFPIPLRKFTGLDDVSFDAKQFKLHLEVTIPIPGLIGELKTFEQTVYVWKPAAPRAREMTTFEFTAPEDGATFEEGQSIVLEYTAVNVHEMYVFVDERSHLKKTHVSDGNLLLRELGVGLHTFEVRALDERGKAAAPSTLHVKIIERQNVETP
ncbi:hypothetical protein BBO99_00003915 [Phytophthora kernoviae]|uniref:Uncharacterized protein n=1 Tax=Phytophthora kernoviae TaxID=325452 RepID=A0A421F1Z7_9STRA|nr:hypothetical protein JM16_003554 [Phytophthora kernoviae]RLN15001.1 hypothetical protein BBI17_003939 [Phytophthora kernoviae]RLN81183.1 hypothetical protein BBO99_00003915 [Phytophthora kernoviae]